jgi:RHS repeat-associated protein
MASRKPESIVSDKEAEIPLIKSARLVGFARARGPLWTASPVGALLFVAGLALFLAPLARAQAPYPYDPVQDTSDNPLRLQHGSEIDIIDLDTGTLTVKIPLISYPQRGGILRADFTLLDRTDASVYRKYSIPMAGGRMTWQACAPLGSCGGVVDSGAFPAVIYSGFPGLLTTVSPGGAGEAYDQGWITEADGSNHLVGWINTTKGRALDGTGFSVNAVTPPYIITDKNGVTTSHPSGSTSVITTDPNGNTMTLSNINFDGGVPTITDTVGRVLPGSGSDGSWVLPGANGGSLTFGFQSSIQPTSTQDMVTLPDGTSYTFQYSAVTMPLLTGQTTAQKTALLTQVTLPAGGTIVWAYSATPAVSPCPGGDYYFPVTSRTVNANDGSGPHTWTYTYNLSASGAGSTTVIDPLGEKSIYTFGLTSCQPYPTQVQKYDNKGNLLQTVTNTYSHVTAEGLTQFLNVNETKQITAWPNGQQSEASYTYDRDNGTSFQFSTLLFFDPNGVVYQDPGTGPAGYTGSPWTATATDFANGAPGPVLRQTKTTYLAFSGPNASSYLADNFLAQPYTIQILDSGNHQKALTTYNYDESNGSPSGIHGNLTSVSRWLNTGTAVKTQTIYNGEGMPAKVCDANDTACANPTIYTYDSTGMFPSSVQYPTTGSIQQIDHVAYDKNTGELTSHTDPNGVVTNYSYDDPLDRLTLIDSAPSTLDAVGLSAESKTSYGYSSATEASVAQDQNTTGDGALKSSTFYDGLGRVAKTVGRDNSVVETAYNGLGQVCAVSNPTFNDPGALSCTIGANKTTAPTDGYTYFSYDALGRMTLQTQPDSSTKQWLYNGNVVDFYDEDKSHWQRTGDGLGRLTKVLENDPAGSGSLTLETDYTYDPLDNLLSVNQKGASGDTPRLRTFAYDSLSRLTNACNPEAIAAGGSCSASGPWSAAYAYDADSNMTTRTDARAIVTHYSYDALNRITAKSYTNDPANTPALGYSYDTEYSFQTAQNENHPIGHLNGITATVGTTNVVSWASGDYDQRGNLTGYLTCLGSNVQGCPTASGVAASIFYDLNDSIFNLNGISGGATSSQAFGYSYSRDNAGRLNLIQTAVGPDFSSTDNVFVSNAFSGPTFYPGGAVETASLAQEPAIALTRTYDNRGRITGEVDTSSQSQNIYNYTVQHDGAGNVTSYNDSVAGTWTVTNDALHRLSSMAGTLGGVAATVQQTYDHFGNRNVETISSGGNQTQPSPYLNFTTGNNRAAGSSYDNAGNLLYDGLNNYLYDAENRLCAVQQVSTGGDMIGYLYGAKGNRLGKGNLTSFSCDLTKNGMLTASGIALTSGYDTGLQGEQLEVTDGNFNMQQYNILWEGKLLGTYTGTGTTYAQSNWTYALDDWLGTKRVVTTSAGTCVSTFINGPFGDFQTPGCTGVDPSDQHFTSKQRDSESGLDYFQARHYNSNWGRFMSPDLMGGRLANPQTLNRYAYVANNPLRFTDPTGLYHCEGGSGSTQDECNSGGGMWTTDPGDPGNGQIARDFAFKSPGSNSSSNSSGQSSAGSDSSQSPGGSGNSFDAGSIASLLFGSQGAPYFTGANQFVTRATIGYTAMYGGVLGGPAAYSGSINLAARGFGWYYGYTGASGVVLGTFADDYRGAAQSIGANYLNASDEVYNFFNNAGEWWTLNEGFLQASIFRDQQFYLKSDPMGTGGFYMEMLYLQSRGIDPFTLPRVLVPR